MFLVLYKALPNTHVSWRAAVLGALVADVLWQTTNMLYSLYVSDLARGQYSVIYGPFGAVILFMIWIYLTALILLVGAELAAAYDIHRQTERQLALTSFV
jgi:membrane protein